MIPLQQQTFWTAAVQEIQNTVENSIELKSNKINTHALPQQEKLDQTNGIVQGNQHPIDIQKTSDLENDACSVLYNQEKPQEEES